MQEGMAEIEGARARKENNDNKKKSKRELGHA